MKTANCPTNIFLEQKRNIFFCALGSNLESNSSFCYHLSLIILIWKSSSVFTFHDLDIYKCIDHLFYRMYHIFGLSHISS